MQALLKSFLCFALFLFLCQHHIVQSQEIFIDAVVASVDGQPITLHDLCARLKPPRNLTLAQAATDSEARMLLDRIILEKLILAEGAAKKMQVSDSDIESYLDEIAARNKMSREDFQNALTKEGLTLEKYKEDVKLEIMKSRLASTFIRGSVSVTDEEVEKYLDERIGKAKGSTQLELRQIVISSNGRSRSEAKNIATEVKTALENGENFAELAKKFSESPDRNEGGSLGVVEEKDLNAEIFDIVFPLKEGQISDIVEIGESFRIFKVEKRFGGTDKRDERLMNEARSEIQKKKMEDKFQTYFMDDLYKQHSVDKKI
ncbi:MAG: hypothetical protein GYA55_06560 [SAR324 cluster bacterium]|uniref:PpiC domain-containing protein n=1 Tax=SAR324 cluster bacterium TaxID=2024889 RepID=A0A7X9IJM9_9DELT|nr:hypothetical protein [SAR324 cluster bacterium]